MKEVEQDYGNLIAKAGQLQYQIKIAKDDLDVLNEQLKELNFEAAAINAKAKKDAEEAASASAVAAAKPVEAEVVSS
jgi:hypothetical protein